MLTRFADAFDKNNAEGIYCEAVRAEGEAHLVAPWCDSAPARGIEAEPPKGKAAGRTSGATAARPKVMERIARRERQTRSVCQRSGSPEGILLRKIQ